MNAPLQKLILLTLFLSLSTNISFSQSNDKSSDPNTPLKYVQIGFINETAVYYYFSLNEKLMLKSGVSVFWNYDDKNNNEGYHINQNSSNSESEEKLKSNSGNNNYEIILSSLAMYSINDYELAKIYLGVGPSILYSLSKSSSNYSQYTDTTYSRGGSESQLSTFGFGPAVSVSIKSKLYGNLFIDRKSTRLNSSHSDRSRMPSSA